MRGPASPAAAAALVLGLMACLAGARELKAAKSARIQGYAVVIHQDLPNGNSGRVIGLVTSKQKRVLLSPSSINPALLDSLTSGVPITVGGNWDDATFSVINNLLGLLGTSLDSLLDGLNFTPRLLVEDLAAQLPVQPAPIIQTLTNDGPVGPARRLLADPPPDPLLVALPLSSSAVNTLIVPVGGVTSTSYGGNFVSGASACTGVSMPSLNPYNVRRTVFEDFTPDAPTVGSTFRQCSMNRTLLDQGNSLVTQTVYTKCSGSSWGIPWKYSTCSFDDYNGIADEVDRILKDERGINITQYTYKVYLLPTGPCGFVGMGMVGCDGTVFDCRVWIAGDYWGNSQVYVHELSHNLYLGHAGAYNSAGAFDDYGDWTCFMGYASGSANDANRCANLPHSYQLGWSSLTQLDASSLPKGYTYTAYVASNSNFRRAGVRIMAGTWLSGQDPIYIGYRTAINGDIQLPASLASKVHIYTSASTGGKDPKVSALRATMLVNDIWSLPTAGLYIKRINNFSAQQAMVSATPAPVHATWTHLLLLCS